MEPEAPLPTLLEPARPGVRSPSLLVMLAGAYDRAEDFIAHDFAQLARQHALPHDLCFLATDLAALVQGDITRRLQESVVIPARAAGYQRILLGGISIGAQVAMIHADDYPDAVEQRVLIAPYPGNRMITAPIERAGALAAWQAGELLAEQGEWRAWRALQSLAASPRPGLVLAYGAEDRFAAAHQLMAAALPAGAALCLPGKHDWACWRALWLRLLELGSLA